MDHIVFLLICTVWGSSFLLMKKAALVFGPFTIGGLRVACGALVLGIVWWATRTRFDFRRVRVLPLVATLLLGYTLPFAIQPYLVSRYGSGFIGLMVGLVPLLTVLISVPLLRVFPTTRQLLGVVGGLGCMAILMNDGLSRSIPSGHLLLASFVPAAYAIANILMKKYFARQSPLAICTIMLISSGTILLPIGLTRESVHPEGGMVAALGCLALLGFIGTGIAQYAFLRLIRDRGPLYAGMVTNLIPVGALLLGWLDQERVTAAQVGALVGVFFMVILVQSEFVKSPD